MKPRIVGFMNAYSDGMSGSDACFIEIMKRIDGFDLVVLTSSLGESVCRERGLNASFWVTSREKEFSRAALIYAARTIRALSFLPRIQNRDILFSSSDFVPDVVPAFVANTLRNKTRWYQRTFHMIPADRFVSHAGQRLSHWLIRRASDHVITDNELLRRYWIEKGIGANCISVSYPGVDPKRYSPPGARPTAEYDAVYLGRLHRSKGIFDLPDIWSRVTALRPGAQLALIGRGPLDIVRELEREIAARGLTSGVHVLGYLETSEAIATLHRSRLLAFPSREEGFGMAILEAFAAGLPAVAWDLPVYDEAFPRGLWTVPMADNEAFAGAIVGLLNDDDGRRRLSADAGRLIERYDWSRIAADMKRLITEDAVR